MPFYLATCADRITRYSYQTISIYWFSFFAFLAFSYSVFFTQNSRKVDIMLVEAPLLLVEKGSVKMALKIAADDDEEKRL